MTRGNKYSFSRLSGATSHPFYITDSISGGAPSKHLKKNLSGDRRVLDGVIDPEELTLKIGKKFKLDELYYFCTSRLDDMFRSFSITDKKKYGKDRALMATRLGLMIFRLIGAIAR